LKIGRLFWDFLMLLMKWYIIRGMCVCMLFVNESVNVKFTIEEAMKTQMGSRGIAVLFV
jgi:hypothetical protein